MPKILLLILACYRAHLRLYPSELRIAYGGEMQKVFEQQLCSEWDSRGLRGIVATGWDAFRDLFTIALPAQLLRDSMIASYLSLVITSAVLFFLVAMLQDRALAKWVNHQFLLGGRFH
jgi:hypothetical protein